MSLTALLSTTYFTEYDKDINHKAIHIDPLKK